MSIGSRLNHLFITIAIGMLVWALTGAQMAQSTGDTTLCVEVTSDKSPGNVTFRVSWNLTCNNSALPASALSQSDVYCYMRDASGFGQNDMRGLTGSTNDWTFVGKKYETDYYFEIKVTGVNGKSYSAKSEILRIAPTSESIKPRPGTWGLLKQSYHLSTYWGKRAFDGIGLFFGLGLLLWLIKTWPAYRSVNVFLWSREEYRQALEKQPRPGGEGTSVDHPAESAGSNPGSDERRAAAATSAVALIDKGLLLEEIHWEEVSITHNKWIILISKWLDWLLWGISLRWVLKLLHWKDKLNLAEVPTVRILQSGVEAAKNGSNIQDVLDSRVSAEMEKLRERGFIDMIWAFGVTSPLLGLFGTITGLTSAFGEVVDSAAKPNTPTHKILQSFSSGIYEALWTTFCGLVAGVILMMIYYYYGYKLSRIGARWEALAADLSESLNRVRGISEKTAPQAGK